jgi:short subunit dehydrogenase-like uncharacterized protein
MPQGATGFAGRNRPKRERVKQQLGSKAASVPLLVANIHEQAAVELVKRSG